MIELENVTKNYFEGKPNEVRAVRGVSLRLDGRGVSVIRGPSGSGKTTLLTLIGGLARPSSGRIRLDGELMSNLPEKFLADLRRRHFGFVFQRFNLIRGLSVEDNVMIPAFPLGGNHGELRKRARELLEKLGLAHRISMKVDLLSGGEAQRVAVARALINDPQIIIADEPTANLDSKLAVRFLELMDQLHREGRGIIMTSHDPRIWGADMVERVITMEDGRIISARRSGGGRDDGQERWSKADRQGL